MNPVVTFTFEAADRIGISAMFTVCALLVRGPLIRIARALERILDNDGIPSEAIRSELRNGEPGE